MKKKSRNNKLRKKLHKFPKKWVALVIVLIVIVLAGSVFALVRSKDNKPAKPSTLAATPGKATLSITSEPAGIQMTAADPVCDSAKLNKTTPYVCTSEAKDLNTVITAPATVSKNGKAYIFTTWDGCSASNSDKKICKIDIAVGKIKTLKATYTLRSSASSDSNSATKVPATATSASDPEHNTANALSAPGCAAPSAKMEEYPYSKTYGDVVYCLLDVDVPAGSMIYYNNNVSEPLYPSNTSTTIDATTAYASCYIADELATEEACVRNPDRPNSGPHYYPVGFQSIFGRNFDPAASDGVKILKISTLVIATSNTSSTQSCGVGCYPTGTIYHFDRWQIEKTTNNDGTIYYKITTYRKYITTVPNRYNGL